VDRPGDEGAGFQNRIGIQTNRPLRSAKAKKWGKNVSGGRGKDVSRAEMLPIHPREHLDVSVWPMGETLGGLEEESGKRGVVQHLPATRVHLPC